MKKAIYIVIIAIISNTCAAAIDLNCNIYNGKQLVTSKNVSLRNKEFPSLWAKKNPGRYASHRYRRQFCQEVGLAEPESQKDVEIRGLLQHNITIKKRTKPDQACQISCVQTNGYGNSIGPQATNNLSVASQALGYIAAR